MAFASTSTEFAMLDTRTTSGAFVLPPTTDIPGRIINIKDPYGAFGRSTLTIYTSGGDTFEDGTTSRLMNNPFDNLQLYAGSTTRWYLTGGTYQNIDTANVAVISTLQTYNWASLCNAANIGYGSTFNPAAIGEISLLDNIFTSSTAGLVSTFIEIGNLNAQPAGMNPGGIFRWVFGTEPNLNPANGLDFKFKRWNSFGLTNSLTRYGANNSTLQDVLHFDNAQNMIFYGGASFISSVNPTNPGIFRITHSGGSQFIQFGSTTSANAGGTLFFTSFQAGQSYMQLNTTPLNLPQLGIGAAAFSSFTLDVNGVSRGKVPLSTITGTSVTLQAGSYGIVHNLTNTGFNAVTLPNLGTAQSNHGWTVPMRNATGVAMSITITGAVSSTPPSPFPLASSNTANFYWDGALFRVF